MDVKVQIRVETKTIRARIVRFEWRLSDLRGAATLKALSKAVQSAFPPLSSSVGPSTHVFLAENTFGAWVLLASDHELRHAIQSWTRRGQLNLRFEEVGQNREIVTHAPMRSASPTPRQSPRGNQMRPSTPDGHRMAFSGSIISHQPIAAVESTSKQAWGDSPLQVSAAALSSAAPVMYPKRRTATNPTNVPPPKTDLYEPKKIKHTAFQQYYKRGDIPARIHHGAALNSIAWAAEWNELNFELLIPIFVAGILEQEDPISFIARQGAVELIHHAALEEVVPLIPTLFPSILSALDTKHPQTMAWGLHLFNLLSAKDKLVADALVPYYRYLLPTIRMYIDRYIPVDETHEAKRRKFLNFNEVLMQTLRIMEQYGGQEAIRLLKKAVPTYQNV
eukprot:TRINITY_DN2197_c0_g2_i5.p1 TRINITY_DN2197_c0_g2~~TRINITY_DN2197_c0_g2_i5.p1  ORF type:complete len:392 (+),score=74.21 TRINITY_DN2197_c0_g2_i5:48-1223(+)